jgi:hypothetical protein
MDSGIGTTGNDGIGLYLRDSSKGCLYKILNSPAIRLRSPTKETTSIVGDIYP